MAPVRLAHVLHGVHLVDEPLTIRARQHSHKVFAYVVSVLVWHSRSFLSGESGRRPPFPHGRSLSHLHLPRA
jgi:hypothetical protein